MYVFFGYNHYIYMKKEHNMSILHFSANMRKKIKMADLQSLPENQLKRHILV